MYSVLIYDANDVPAIAITRSLGKRGVEVHLASEKKDAPAFFSKFCSEKHIVKGFEDAIGLMERHEFDVFIPLLSEREMLKLSKIKPKIERKTKVVCGSYKALVKLINKREFTQTAIDAEIPTPETLFPESDKDVEGFLKENGEVLVKLSISSGGQGVHMIADIKEYLSLKEELGFSEKDIIIQRKINGKHVAVSILCRGPADPIAIFTYERIRYYPYPYGPATYIIPIRYESCENYSMKLINELGYSGIINFDFIVDDRDGIPKILDANPRFWGAVGATMVAGIDFPWMVFNHALGRQVQIDAEQCESIHLRSIIDDCKAVYSILRSSDSSAEDKLKHLFDFLNFPKYTEFMFSLKDPAPIVVEILRIVKRRVRSTSNEGA